MLLQQHAGTTASLDKYADKDVAKMHVSHVNGTRAFLHVSHVNGTRDCHCTRHLSTVAPMQTTVAAAHWMCF